MYINPILIGVIGTLLVEVILVVVLGLITMNRKGK